MQTITFSPDTNDFYNPERGPFLQIGLEAGEGDYGWVSNYGVNIVRANIRLDNWRTSLIPQTKLDDMDIHFDLLRGQGIGCILHFQYATQGDDATKAQILEHINQVQYLLEKHQDIILCMQAGFIGWWGEWHSSTNGLENTQDRSDILHAILDALPASRMVLIRTPYWKYDIFQDVLDSARAFDGSDLARVGHQHDTLLGGWESQQSWGYLDPTNQYIPYDPPFSQWKDNLWAEAPYVVCVGETGNANDLNGDHHVTCPYAEEWFEGAHWNHLNKNWSNQSNDILKADGCWDEILFRMGYRYVLDEATFPDQKAPGQNLSFQLKLHNEGYGSLYNARAVYLVLRNATDRYDLEIANLDPRFWSSGNHVINDSVTLPPNIAEGDYEISLWLPDAFASIRDDPRYAVRFANLGTWDAQLGLNILGQTTIGGLMSVITDLQAVEAALRAEAAAVTAQADAIAQTIVDLQAVDDTLDAAADVIEAD